MDTLISPRLQVPRLAVPTHFVLFPQGLQAPLATSPLKCCVKKPTENPWTSGHVVSTNLDPGCLGAVNVGLAHLLVRAWPGCGKPGI